MNSAYSKLIHNQLYTPILPNEIPSSITNDVNLRKYAAKIGIDTTLINLRMVQAAPESTDWMTTDLGYQKMQGNTPIYQFDSMMNSHGNNYAVKITLGQVSKFKNKGHLLRKFAEDFFQDEATILFYYSSKRNKNKANKPVIEYLRAQKNIVLVDTHWDTNLLDTIVETASYSRP